MKLSALPEGWTALPIGKVVSAQYGLSAAATPNGGVPILGMQHIVAGQIARGPAQRVPLSDAEKETYLLRPGDLLFNRTNSLDQVGKSAVVPTWLGECVFASYLVRLTVDNRRALPEFLSYVLNSPGGASRLRELATPGVSQYNINPTTLRKHFIVPLPPLPEQRLIVGTLLAWDGAVAHVDRLLEANRRFKRGLMQELLTGKRRFREFQRENWSSLHLGEWFKEYAERNSDEQATEILSCTKKGIVRQRDRFSKRLASRSIAHYKVVRRGDFVYDPMLLWDASLGFVEVVDLGVVSPAYETLHFTGIKSDRIYVQELLETPFVRHQFRVISQGTNQRRRKAMPRDFLKIFVPAPESPREREAIGSLAAALNTEIKLLERWRDALDRQRCGVAELLLSGKVRILT